MARLVAGMLLAACGGSSDEETTGEVVQEVRRGAPVPMHMDGLEEELVLHIREAVDTLEKDLGNSSAWLELGMLYERARMRALALACYEEVQLREPDNPKAWYRSAISRWRRGDPHGGLADMDRVLELEPEYTPAYYRRGIFQLDAGDMQGAEESFARGREVDPSYVGCWVGGARVHLQRDEADEAVVVLERILEQHPGDAKVCNLLVTAYRQAGIESDLTLIPTAVLGDTPNPDWGDPWQEELMSARPDSFVRRITRYLQPDGDPRKAVELLEARRSERPDELTFESHLADAYFQVGRVGDAREIQLGILGREPDNVRVRLQLARYHVHEEHSRLAIRRLDEIIAIDRTHAAAWLLKGGILFGEEQFESAVPVLERAFDLDQRDPEPLVRIGNSHMALLQWGPAAEAFRAYLERVPDAGNVYLELARAEAKRKHLEEAQAALQRALQLGVDRRRQIHRVELLIRNLRERIERRKNR